MNTLPTSIEVLSVTELTAYTNNSRVHSNEVIAQLVNSIQKFGFTNPILVDENNVVIAGHGRLQAAKILEMPGVPCLRLTGLTPAQVRAYVIADNKLALNSGWDMEILRSEMLALHNDGFEVDMLGFGKAELQNMLVPFQGGETTSTKELDVGSYQMEHTCPECGFEFDGK